MLSSPPISTPQRFAKKPFLHNPGSQLNSSLLDAEGNAIKESTLLDDKLQNELTAVSSLPASSPLCDIKPRLISPVAVPFKQPNSPCIKTPLSFINTSLDQLSSPLTSPISLKYHDISSPLSTSIDTPTSAVSHVDCYKHLPSSTMYSKEEVIAAVESCIIDASFFKLEIQKLIGCGSFSNVLSCKVNDKTVAIKVPKDKKSYKLIFKELMNYKVLEQHLQDMTNLPILNIMGLTFLDKSNYSKIRYGEIAPCLISERLHSNLEELIKSFHQTSSFSSKSLSFFHIGSQLWWKLAKELVMGLLFLKKCSLIHLDLKPQNILYDSITQDFKIADFTSAGLSSDILNQYDTMMTNGSFFDVTLQYCAPELLQSPPSVPSFESDLYAVGLILLNAVTGIEPYSEALSSVSTSSKLIYLNECIKKNKVLDVLSIDELKILQGNTEVYDLLKLIIVERAPLDQVINYINSFQS